MPLPIFGAVGVFFLFRIFGWLVNQIGWLVLGGGIIYLGKETGLLVPVLDALFTVLGDVTYYLADEALMVMFSQLDGVDLDIPDASVVMAGFPDYSVRALAAVGVWEVMALLLSLLVVKAVWRMVMGSRA